MGLGSGGEGIVVSILDTEGQYWSEWSNWYQIYSRREG
jgi:hypothetical protein